MTNFSDILREVPDYREFLTVDELNTNSEALAKDHSDIVRLLDLGNSSNGEPIRCLSIGNGRNRALIYGFPNPEEPLGGVLLDYFSEAIVKNRPLLKRLDFTWYLIKCIDPDGARRNQGFVKGPLTPLNFAENYYRKPQALSGEFNFPYRIADLDLNNPLPETKALMTIMDSTSLDLISSLHNWKWGGIYYRVSEPCPQLYAHFQQLAKAHNIYAEKRPFSGTLAPYITLGWFNGIRNYIGFRAAGKGPLEEITGAFTLEYAQLLNPGAFMMVPECGIWYDVRYADDRPSDASMAEVMSYVHQVASETGEFILSLYEKAKPLLKKPSPFLEMVQHHVSELRSNKINTYVLDPELGKEQLERRATLGDKIATEGRADVYRLFNLGGMIRMFDDQLAKQAQDRSTLESYRSEAAEKLEEWNRTVGEKYDLKCYPIRDLVSVGLGSILYSAEYVKRKRKWIHWI